jgi:hypothetical protein
MAALGLYSDRLARMFSQAPAVVTLPFRVLRTAHSGHLGDYVVWLLIGVTLLTIGLATT